MPRATGSDLVELYGYAPDDLSPAARQTWASLTCPFLGERCIKQGATGVCSVTGSRKTRSATEREEIIVCPIRLYAKDYAVIKTVARDAFGDVPLLFYPQYVALGVARPTTTVVAFGHNSGGEIGFSDGRSRRSIDWVLTKVNSGEPTELVGIEVQSIDTTGNYLANRDAYVALHSSVEVEAIPNTNHGLNYANVWKRLLPQIILKGPALATSTLCTKGLYFVLPEEVYQRFEDTAPNIPTVEAQDKDTVTVYT